MALAAALPKVHIYHLDLQQNLVGCETVDAINNLRGTAVLVMISSSHAEGACSGHVYSSHVQLPDQSSHPASPTGLWPPFADLFAIYYCFFVNKALTI